jgi:phosphoribosyl 1,2-cyclic phosphodiesterase
LSDWIKFMGTAGARFVVSRQLRSSAGTWCSLQGLNLLIDPGPGTLSRCFSSKPKLDPADLDVLILTHRHLDHSTDVNVIIEAMTQGTFNHRGVLFAPADAVAQDEPAVFRHTRSSVERLELLAAGKEYDLGPLSFTTPLRHRHPVETYGLNFSLPRGRVSFITDTAYFPELAEPYSNSDILILNVVFYDTPPAKQIQHLDLAGARKLIEAIKPRLAVLTHFGLTMLHHKPHLAARRLADETGVPVVAARDGMSLHLDEIFAS